MLKDRSFIQSGKIVRDCGATNFEWPWSHCRYPGSWNVQLLSPAGYSRNPDAVGGKMKWCKSIEKRVNQSGDLENYFCCTGKQWRLQKTGVKWSYFGVPMINRAAALWTLQMLQEFLADTVQKTVAVVKPISNKRLCQRLGGVWCQWTFDSSQLPQLRKARDSGTVPPHDPACVVSWIRYEHRDLTQWWKIRFWQTTAGSLWGRLWQAVFWIPSISTVFLSAFIFSLLLLIQDSIPPCSWRTFGQPSLHPQLYNADMGLHVIGIRVRSHTIVLDNVQQHCCVD